MQCPLDQSKVPRETARSPLQPEIAAISEKILTLDFKVGGNLVIGQEAATAHLLSGDCSNLAVAARF